MQITVHHEKKELLIQTVSLIKNLEDPENIYLFRCPYCSSSTGVQVQGDVVKISAGLDPTEDVVTVHQCKECKRLYTFQTLTYSPKKQTKVTLISHSGAIGIFYCWLCRNPLLQFVGDKVVKLPGFELAHIPFNIDCVNPCCSAKYKIVDLV